MQKKIFFAIFIDLHKAKNTLILRSSSIRKNTRRKQKMFRISFRDFKVCIRNKGLKKKLDSCVAKSRNCKKQTDQRFPLSRLPNTYESAPLEKRCLNLPKLIRRKAVRGIFFFDLTHVFQYFSKKKNHKPPIKNVSRFGFFFYFT